MFKIAQDIDNTAYVLGVLKPVAWQLIHSDKLGNVFWGRLFFQSHVCFRSCFTFCPVPLTEVRQCILGINARSYRAIVALYITIGYLPRYLQKTISPEPPVAEVVRI